MRILKRLGDFHGLPLFSQLPEAIVAKYFSHCLTRKYRKKEEVFGSGEHADYIYLLVSGKIRVYLSYPNGKEFTLTLLQAGDVYSGHTRALGQALADSEVLLIPVESFRKLLVEVPLFAMNVISVLGDSLRNSMNIIESLVFKEVNKRLYHFIYSLALSANRHGESAIQVQLGLTHQQIGTMVGSTRQTVNMFFNNLQKEGIITMGKDKLIIHDFAIITERARDDSE
ncbi:Crp/Fnr family transcriptional regulator [Sporomusa sp. KB1]|uniref:Crp/Fnr family transcriptional regulator n=1 Tax=Sporomusa sp. KB1 TaxID=943346 RepID=UPI00351B81C2